MPTDPRVTYGTAVTPTRAIPFTEVMTANKYVPIDTKSDGIAIVSGGLDSVTMVYQLMNLGYTPHLLSFDYGQRHARELAYALEAAERLHLHWTLVDLSSVTDLIGTSALTSGQELGHEEFQIEVPEGHYAEDNMAITVVPNRNMMMLSIATAAAVSAKYQYVAAGMHAGDHAQYPDCRPEFIHAFHRASMSANEGFISPHFDVLTPWIEWSKDDIAHMAWRLGVQPNWTYSCYKGGPAHCGRCGTCVERLEAIASVNQAPAGWDETVYEDTEFWKTEVEKWKANR